MPPTRPQRWSPALCHDATGNTYLDYTNPVAHPAEPVAMPSYVVEGVRDSCRKRAEELVGGFDWQGVEHGLEIVDANPIEHIRQAQADYDLTVLGQHGEGWLSATVLGSTAYAVLKAADRIFRGGEDEEE